MNNLFYNYKHKDVYHNLEMVFICGIPTECPFLFGTQPDTHAVNLNSFYLAKFQTTQAFWEHITGDDSKYWGSAGDDHPADHVSYNDIVKAGGFLEQLNNSPVMTAMRGQLSNSNINFRLPTETEWEYAARGGQRWTDNFTFGGSNNPDEVAWHLNNSEGRTHPVGQKSPNQLGLYDMNGNVWEWCQDSFVRDTAAIPTDGSPYTGPSADRVLRGGCHHNGAIHCTSTKRYEIAPTFADGCIGFRLAMDA